MTSTYTSEQWATMHSGGALAPTIQWELAEEIFSGMYENLSDEASELEYREAAIITAERLLSSSVVARIRAEAIRDAASRMPWSVNLPGGGVSLDHGNGFKRWLLNEAGIPTSSSDVTP